MGKLYGVVSSFSVATLMAGTGFVGFLFVIGKLNPLRMELIATVLRGEMDTYREEIETRAASQPAASQPAPRESNEALRERELRDELLHAQGERALRDIEAQQALLNQTLVHLVTEQERFAADRTAWQQQQDRLRKGNRDEGFELELRTVSKLDSTRAKEHLLATWRKHPADAVRLLKGLGTRGPKILNEFKSPEELQIMHSLLEQLREQDIDKLGPNSRRNTAAPQNSTPP